VCCTFMVLVKVDTNASNPHLNFVKPYPPANSCMEPREISHVWDLHQARIWKDAWLCEMSRNFMYDSKKLLWWMPK